MIGAPLSGTRLQAVDVLRGIAILLVLAIHVPHDAPGGWRENPWFLPAFLFGFGYLGVPLFHRDIRLLHTYRASAFSKAATGTYAFDWVRFWKRRFVRLYPPYLAAIAFSLVCAFWLHQRFEDPARFLGWDLATHLLLVHNLTSEFAGSLGNGAFWSLGTEEQLYALYVLLLLMLARLTGRVSLMVVALVTIAWRIWVPFLPAQGADLGPFHLGQWFQWPFHYWLHWALGAFAVEAHAGLRTLPSWSRSGRWGLVLLAMGLVCNQNTFEMIEKTRVAAGLLESVGPVSRGVLHNLGELLILVGIFCLLNRALAPGFPGRFPGWVAAFLASVGKVSYSIYLVHIPVIYVLLDHVTLGGTPGEWLPRMLVFAVPALAFGYVFHFSVERWFLQGRFPTWAAQSAPAVRTQA